MTPSARLSAAIEVLADIFERRRPASDALKDWGLSHRFAGSGDRAAIGGLVFDALRHKASSAFVMGGDTPRAVLLGMLARGRKLTVDAMGGLFDGGRFAPSPLTEAERRQVASPDLSDAPPDIRGDYPAWLDPQLAAVFGEARADEGAALATRAPLDLRVNTLKAERAAVADSLAEYRPETTPWSPHGLRIALGPQAKSPPVQVEPAFLKGWVEVQDEGSQLAALLAASSAGEQVVDLCAGAGGKTLALAAAMGNRGQLYATDSDKRRLAPIHERLERAGVRNVQVRTPRGDLDVLADLAGTAELVVVDAPCSGSGAWRRNPDAKWRMRPGALDQRIADQTRVLDRAAALVRPGGRIVYITCSVLHGENGAQVLGFLDRHPGFSILPIEETLAPLGARAADFQAAVLRSPEGLLMTPRRTGTDGFFVSILRAAAA